MYIEVIWETARSICFGHTCIFFPNLCHTSFFLMYGDVLRWTTILVLSNYIYEKLVVVLILVQPLRRLPLTSRKTLA